MDGDVPTSGSIVVTGASGFVGGAVARRFRELGWTVHAYGQRPRDQVAADLRDDYSSWDIADRTLDEPPQADAVVHCAGKVDDWGPYRAFERVNVDGTRNVVNTWPDARFVHVSTASVYDIANRDTVLHERDIDPLDAVALDRMRSLSPYCRSKRFAEHVVATSAARWAILRPHLVYGPGDTQLVPRLLARARFGSLAIPGDGRHTRIAPIHIDNLLHGIERAIATSANGVFNLVDDVQPTVDEALHAILAAVDSNIRVRYVPRSLAWALAIPTEQLWRILRLRSTPPLHRYTIAHVAWEHLLDSSQARRVLGYAPTRRFPESFASVSIGAIGSRA